MRRFTASVFLLACLPGCGVEGELDAELAPSPPSDLAPACLESECVLKSSGLFAGEPGAGVEFVRLAPQQEANRGGPILTDIISHLPPRYGNTYYDADPITHGHETSHGIHSHIRNTMNQTGRRANGFYVLEDRAVVIAEPNMRKSHVAAFVPASLRGSRYSLYITGQQAWDDTPLYLWDEWNAYANGGAAGVELVELGRWTGGWRDGVAGLIEFVVYALAVAQAVEARDPTYFNENQQFREFLAWNLRRSMQTFRAGRVLEQFRWDRQDTYYDAFRNAPDAEPLRAFSRRLFGDAWANAVLFESGPMPDGPQPPNPPGVPQVPEDPIEPEDPGEPDDPNAPDQPNEPEQPNDQDGDGIPDGVDRCRDTPRGAPVWREGAWIGCAEGQQLDPPAAPPGEPDADRDGVPDRLDQCRNTPAGQRVWRSGEWAGCAQGERRDAVADGPDADGDGVPDDVDLCRNTPRGATVWRDGPWLGCAEGQARD